jgi:hypothetical protein
VNDCNILDVFMDKAWLTKSRNPFELVYTSKGIQKYNILGKFTYINFKSYVITARIAVSEKFLLELILKHNLTCRPFMKGSIEIDNQADTFAKFVSNHISGTDMDILSLDFIW